MTKTIFCTDIDYGTFNFLHLLSFLPSCENTIMSVPVLVLVLVPWLLPVSLLVSALLVVVVPVLVPVPVLLVVPVLLPGSVAVPVLLQLVVSVNVLLPVPGLLPFLTDVCQRLLKNGKCDTCIRTCVQPTPLRRFHFFM